MPDEVKGPVHVAIVGLGASCHAYLDMMRSRGGRRGFCDEVWAVNALGDVIQCDRVFHMDDVRVQQIRADAAPESNIATMLSWLSDHPGPVVTSIAPKDGYPGLQSYPLEDVVNDVRMAYFNNTVAYAIAYAIHLGTVKRLSIFGVDFTYPNAHDAEKGRACVEFWLGIAHERGIEIVVPDTSTLLDAQEPRRRLYYGYDLVDVQEVRRSDGGVALKFVDVAERPTAAAIEAAYDHSKHPHTPAPD